MGTICELPSSVWIHASFFCCLLSLPCFTVQMILARWWAAPSFQQTQYWEFCSVQKIFIFIFSKSFSKFVKLQAACCNIFTLATYWWNPAEVIVLLNHHLNLCGDLLKTCCDLQALPTHSVWHRICGESCLSTIVPFHSYWRHCALGTLEDLYK